MAAFLILFGILLIAGGVAGLMFYEQVEAIFNKKPITNRAIATDDDPAGIRKHLDR